MRAILVLLSYHSTRMHAREQREAYIQSSVPLACVVWTWLTLLQHNSVPARLTEFQGFSIIIVSKLLAFFQVFFAVRRVDSCDF